MLYAKTAGTRIPAVNKSDANSERMNINKIPFSPNISPKGVETDRANPVQSLRVGTKVPPTIRPMSGRPNSKVRLPKGVIVPLTILIVVGVLGYGAYKALGSVIQWEDDRDDGIGRKKELSVDVSNLPTVTPGTSSKDSVDTVSVKAKGKITVTFIKDKGMPFDNGQVQLLNSSGKMVNSAKTGPDGTSGVVVFDQVPAGSYKIVGGRENEIGVRSVSKSVSIDEGEFANVTLKLYIDTPVTVTVTVTNSSGGPLANKSLSLVRPRGDEGDEVLSVTTNDAGVFTEGGVYPDDRWTLKEGDAEIGRFTVEPNGQNQSINVKTSSN